MNGGPIRRDRLVARWFWSLLSYLISTQKGASCEADLFA